MWTQKSFHSFHMNISVKMNENAKRQNTHNTSSIWTKRHTWSRSEVHEVKRVKKKTDEISGILNHYKRRSQGKYDEKTALKTWLSALFLYTILTTGAYYIYYISMVVYVNWLQYILVGFIAITIFISTFQFFIVVEVYNALRTKMDHTYKSSKVLKLLNLIHIRNVYTHALYFWTLVIANTQYSLNCAFGHFQINIHRHTEKLHLSTTSNI